MKKKKPTPFFRSAWKNEAVEIRIPYQRSGEWEQWVLLNADRHFDNPGSDQEMMIRHLDEARERNALILDGGDFFCAMQGKYDKRSSKSSIREEHQHGDYLDRLVDTGFELLKPYSDLMAFMGPGNHETSIHDRHETNLTERLVALLRHEGSQCVRHRYSGYTRFHFCAPKHLDSPRKSSETGASESAIMWHTHGYGGGGPVTKDVIQTARQSVYLDNVDIVMSGHTHDAWTFTVATRELNKNNTIQCKERLHIKIPSAKDKWGKDSWEDLKGMPPKPVGAYWLRFRYSPRAQKIYWDAERARQDV